jgi:hypothetical protein
VYGKPCQRVAVARQTHVLWTTSRGFRCPVTAASPALAAFSSLMGLGFEALRWQPLGMNVAIVFSGCYCLLLGYLIFRSTFLPRYLGALMAVAGLSWLTYLSTPLADYLSPYNLAFGLLGESLVMLWLLVVTLNAQKWNEGATRSD